MSRVEYEISRLENTARFRLEELAEVPRNYKVHTHITHPVVDGLILTLEKKYPKFRGHCAIQFPATLWNHVRYRFRNSWWFKPVEWLHKKPVQMNCYEPEAHFPHSRYALEDHRVSIPVFTPVPADNFLKMKAFDEVEQLPNTPILDARKMERTDCFAEFHALLSDNSDPNYGVQMSMIEHFIDRVKERRGERETLKTEGR